MPGAPAHIRIGSIVLSLAVSLACSPRASADDKFKGDGTPGGLMPDFTQDQGQKVKGICSAAASADALWYLDQHNFARLVDHSNADPNKTWHDDAKTLVLKLADLIFGKDYMAGKGGGITDGLQKGLRTYLKQKGFDKVTPQRPTALTVKHRDVIDAYYDWWKFYGTDPFYPAIGDFSWRDDKNKIIKYQDNVGRTLDARHAMAVAGIDTTDAMTHVVMGWGDHPTDMPPYKAPPYAAGEEPYIDTYGISLQPGVPPNRKRLWIPSDPQANLFKRIPADHISLDAIDSIENPKTAVRGGPKAPAKPLGATRTGPKSSSPSQQEYDYTVSVDATNEYSVQQFFLQVQVPFSMSSVVAPTGWNYIPWDPTQTPEITPIPEPITADGPIVDPDAGDWMPDFNGVLFYTLDSSKAVDPGGMLGGFGFSTDAAYPFEEDSNFAGVSSSPVALVNSLYEGSSTEYTFVGGPMVPEPGALLICLAAWAPLRRRMR